MSSIVTIFANLIGVHAALAGTLADGINNTANKAATTAGLSTGKLETILINGLGYLLTFMSIIGVAALCYGGFLYLTAFGNDKKAALGKQVVMYAIIGLVVIALSGIIVNTVINTLK